MAHELPEQRDKHARENMESAYAAHPCLEVFCYCCLPDIRSRKSWTHHSVHWNNIYLRFLHDADIGIDGFAIDNTNDHGTGFYISHSMMPQDKQCAKLLGKAFGDRLRRCIRSYNNQPLVDREDKKQLEYHISACDVFLPIVTPYYQNSMQCMLELELARKYSKFIIPLTFEDVPQEFMPVGLLNYLPFLIDKEDDGSCSYHTMYQLTETIFTDIKEEELHIRCHTKLLLRALFWDTMDFAESILLTGTDVTRATNWLISTQLGAEPQPTLLHLAFIRESQDFQLLSGRRHYVAVILIILWFVAIATPSVGSYTSMCVFLHLLISLSGDQYY